jgi:hypothetical protein
MAFYGGAAEAESARQRTARARRTCDAVSARIAAPGAHGDATEAHDMRTPAASPPRPALRPPRRKEATGRVGLVGGVNPPSLAPESSSPSTSPLVASIAELPRRSRPASSSPRRRPSATDRGPDDPTTSDPVQWLRDHCVFGDLAQGSATRPCWSSRLRGGWPDLGLIAACSGRPRTGSRAGGVPDQPATAGTSGARRSTWRPPPRRSRPGASHTAVPGGATRILGRQPPTRPSQDLAAQAASNGGSQCPNSAGRKPRPTSPLARFARLPPRSPHAAGAATARRGSRPARRG